MLFEMIPPQEKLPEVQIEQHYTIEKSLEATDQLRFSFPTLSSIAASHLTTMDEAELDKDWRLDELFETIILINLPQATERLENATKQLNNIGVYNFEVFRAIDGRKEVGKEIWSKFHSNRDAINPSKPEGKANLDLLHQAEAGCYLSHYKVVEKVKNAFDAAVQKMNDAKQSQDQEAWKDAYSEAQKFSRVLILEDDCNFGRILEEEVVTQGSGVFLRKNLRELPNDWQMLYFVAGVLEPTDKVTKHIYKIYNSWSCLGYAVNYTMYVPLLNHLKRIEDPAVKKILPVDNEISSVHYKFNVYAMYPSLIYQGIGKSQISPIKGNKKYWQGQPIYKKKRRFKQKFP